MRNLIAILIMALSPITASAGVGGGGVGPRPGMGLSIDSEIVFQMGQENGRVKFAYGQLVDKMWKVQSIEVSEVELSDYPSVVEALEGSVLTKAWVEIKK